MDDLPPPPYTPHDPFHTAAGAPASPNHAGQGNQLNLRGGYMRPSLPSERPSEESNLSSAATYFDERPFTGGPALQNAGVNLNLIEHNVTLNPETTRDDLNFPRPAETYLVRDVTVDDWSTFVNYLFPAPNTQTSNGKVKPGKDVKRHLSHEEDTPERRQRIESIIAEWNENFFSPRFIHINVDFSPLPSQYSRSTPYAFTPQHLPTNPSQHPRPINRSESISSTSSSSSSSSSSSVDSITSKDLEGADIGQIRSALLTFKLDITKKEHLRQSVRQLRDEFRSQRRDLSWKERKDLKKEYKEQRKEVKKEVKAVVKEIRATRKADRKLRKAERKCRREGKRAERRGSDRVRRSHEKGQRAERRAGEKTLRAHERGREAEERASKKVMRAHGRAREAEQRASEIAVRAHERAREAQDRGNVAVASAQAQAAEWRARDWESEAAARERAREVETRAQELAWNAEGRHWGNYGSERAREAEQRARETGWRVGWRRQLDGQQETGVLLQDE
ncbi:hypothetical protein MMC28_005312 [Mycoblastus sanguinarius]|nr:hypothetical protein [Mycoblastus sanguinarius]